LRETERKRNREREREPERFNKACYYNSEQEEYSEDFDRI
jgi:hypothetical protein